MRLGQEMGPRCRGDDDENPYLAEFLFRWDHHLRGQTAGGTLVPL